MLDNFFKPSSVAVIGASREAGKVGYEVVKNLIDNGFSGRIYPINPKADEILGLKAYPNVNAVTEHIGLAVIVIPSQFIISAIEDCGKKGIDSVIIITAGFKESGSEGAKLEQELAHRTKELGIRVIGPNCLGVMDTYSKLNASFAAGMPPQGKIAFFSQSGALGTAILDWAIKENIGFSKFISMGNKMDVNEADLLTVLADDPETNVILGYIEGVKNGREFMKSAFEATKKKPVILFKSGSTAAGAKAASSHTGTLAGSENAFISAFKQCGILRAPTMEALFDYALVLAYQPLPKGNRLAILTNAGGPGIIAADACEKSSLTMANFQTETIELLRKSLPSTAALYNPVDVIGDAKADRYLSALKAIKNDKNTSALLVLLTPQAMTEPELTAQYIVDTFYGGDKPVVTSFMGGHSVEGGIKILDKNRIPNYPNPERAVSALEVASKYASWKDNPREIVEERIPVDREKVAKCLAKAEKQSEHTIAGSDAMEVLTEYGFTVPKIGLAETGHEAIELANQIGYPVVMKIASPDILHKSDIGGVRLGINSPAEVERAFEEIISSARRFMPSALILGVTINQMVPRGKEVIVGMAKDPDFGPMLMFGLGGIYVEVLKDVSFRIAPIDRREATAMINEIRSFPLLRGVRGEEPTDIQSIVTAIVRLSQLVTDFPEIIEMDINPLMVMPVGKGAIAVDCRISVEI
ncbi:TPA: CoA-binding protein [Candidatus Poribacteria bacterium]|nr:CoA-binding protein [Candidatus Poribacteria bacterium]